jgi:long-chain acyl-CoA synthetase
MEVFLPLGPPHRELPAMTTTALTFVPAPNLVEPLFRHAARTPDRPLLAYRDGAGFTPVTAREVADRVRRLAAGLLALGVEPGDRVALMSHTRREWTELDLAILAAGAVTVPIYETSSVEQIRWIVGDSGAVAIVVETPEHAERFAAVADDLTTCRHRFVIDEGGIEALVEHGAAVPLERVEARVAALTHDDLATIIYTSGTTGRPKGCVLTHGNVCSNVAQASQAWDAVLGDDDTTLLFLPLAHAFAKIVALVLLERGIQIGYATDANAVTEELPLFAPTLLVGVPRLYERAYNRAQRRAAQDGKERIFASAVATASAFARAKLDDGRVPLGTRVKHAVFDALVYGKLRAAFGGHLRVAVSAGAPLGDRLGYFFNGVGVTLLEGYGLTETSPVLTANTPDDIGVGSVGRPVPGTEIRIAQDGEVLARGPQVFGGYWKNEAATREVIDTEGWFHTGDLGALDARGRLRITGRAKDILITAGGKNVSPAPLEDRLRAHPLIADSVVIGDGRPFIAALIALDGETLAEWAEEHGRLGGGAVDLADDPVLRSVIDEAVADANETVSRAEQIRAYTILPRELSIETGELTPTLKVRRATVVAEYDHLIEELYLRAG